MRKFATIAAASIAMLVGSAAVAQEADPAPPPTPQPTVQPPPPSEAAPVVQPQGAPAPVDLPPPAVAAGVAPQAQWVYTNQYGWVYMPTDRAYTYAPTENGGDPYMYVYYPAWGWRWLAAPWIFGIGPRPYFGAYGWHHYGWYGHPWFGHAWYGYSHGYPSGYHGMVYAQHGNVGGPHVVVNHAMPVVHTAPMAHPQHFAHPGHNGVHAAHPGHGGGHHHR